MAEGVKKELTRVSNALKSNGYSSATISNILKKKLNPEAIPSPDELVGMFFRWTDPPDSQNGFAVLPYIKGVTEPLTRFSTITASEPPPDRLRPCSRNLRLPNQDLHQIGKQAQKPVSEQVSPDSLESKVPQNAALPSTDPATSTTAPATSAPAPRSSSRSVKRPARFQDYVC